MKQLTHIDRNKVLDRISAMKEHEVHDLLIRLFRAMNFSNVEKGHGTSEFGKDIVFQSSDPIDSFYTGCVVKAGDVNQAIATKIIEQCELCYSMPYDSKNGKIKMQKCLVITNGVYKQNTRTIISNHASLTSYKDAGLIKFWDINDIVDNSIKYIADLVTSEEDVQYTAYIQSLLPRLKCHDGLGFLKSDFGLNIDRLESLELKLRVQHTQHKALKSKYLDEGTRPGQSNVPTIDDEEYIFKSNGSFLVTGIPTSGKSAFLKRLGRNFIEAYPGRPLFFIELSKLTILSGQKSLLEILDREYREAIEVDFTHDALASGKSLVLLDGLDELPNDELREHLVKLISDYKELYPESLVVLSSRNIEFIVDNQLVSDTFEQYDLLPLNVNQIIQIGEAINGEGAKSEFTKLIRSSDLIHAFPKTPLTSILLSILYKEGKISPVELPANITELYGKFIDLFLNRWDASKGVSQQFKFKQKEFVIESIAGYMQHRRLRFISHDELVEFLDGLRALKEIDELLNTEDFLADLARNGNIMTMDVSPDGPVYSFFHLTIQEYLASMRLDVESESQMVESYFDEWWLNPTIFYSGKKPDRKTLLNRITKLENYPADLAGKIKYVANTSMMLTALHLVDVTDRKAALRSMVNMFDGMVREVVSMITLDEKHPLRKKSVLDILLESRDFFFRRFRISSFESALSDLWNEEFKNSDSFSDITKYCISYTLSVKTKSESYLMDFYSDAKLNVRWSRIVLVDIEVYGLSHDKRNDRLRQKLARKAQDNADYINRQFRQSIIKHQSSLFN